MEFSQQKRVWKLNWRLLGLHLPAAFLLVMAAREFARLTDLDLLQAISNYSGYEEIEKHVHKINTDTLLERMWHFIHAIFYFGSIAWLIAFAISLSMSIRYRIHWLNPVLVLLMSFFFNHAFLWKLPPFNYAANCVVVEFPFLNPGVAYILNGVIPLFAGLSFFFSPWSRRIILAHYGPGHLSRKEKALQEIQKQQGHWEWE